jgi:hypothetical protein
MRRSSIGCPGDVSGGVTGSTEAEEGEVEPAMDVRELLVVVGSPLTFELDWPLSGMWMWVDPGDCWW